MPGIPSVGELLADPILSEAELIAGSDGLGRVVEDVVMYQGVDQKMRRALVICNEGDVTPAFRLDALVRRAETANAAAVLVLAGRARPLLSGVRLADRLRIPVMWLAGEDHFGVANDLAIHLRAPIVERAAMLTRVVQRMGSKDDAHAILAEVSSIMSMPVGFLAPDGQAIIGETPDLDGLRLDLDVPHGTDRLAVQPVRLEGRTAGWLMCELSGVGESRRATASAMLQITEPFIRAWLVEENARADRDKDFLSRLLNEIIAAPDAAARDLTERAVAVGWRLDGWHVGIHVTSDETRAASHGDLFVNEVRTAITEAGTRLNGVASHSDGWAMWQNWSVQPSPDQVRRVVRSVRQAAAGVSARWGVIAGVGRPHDGPRGLANTLVEARNAGYLARSRDYRPSVEHADELGVAQLLATVQGSEVTRAFAETALAPISGARDEHLLLTLKTHLQNGQSILSTAHALGVHRNTVTSRLQQLQERLGVDLEDPTQLLALQLAVRTLGA